MDIRFGEPYRSQSKCLIIFKGTFGLPFGTFISQPVCMENGEWKPNFDFPSPDKTIIIDILSKVADIAFNYDLGKRFNVHYPTRESRTNIFDE
jgi:hypothetical protein